MMGGSARSDALSDPGDLVFAWWLGQRMAVVLSNGMRLTSRFQRVKIQGCRKVGQ